MSTQVKIDDVAFDKMAEQVALKGFKKILPLAEVKPALGSLA